MLVIHDQAHSAAGRKGAVTAQGTSEREVAARANETLTSSLHAAGHEVVTIIGHQNRNIRVMNGLFTEAQEAGKSVCAVSLHFNSTPLEDCTICGGKRHMGGACACGAPSQVKWKFGHRAVVRYRSKYSGLLAREILRSLQPIIPWSKQRTTITAPDPDLPDDRWPNTLIWPTTTFRPSALIEIGFGPDRRFSSWIKDPASQFAYGEMAAEGIVRWHDAMVAGNVPIEDWKK
jgi:N-acetylmuramoyl-L-alanine amidase